MAGKFEVLLVFACFLLQGWMIDTISAQVLSTSLCTEVHGFSGEYNDNLEIPIQYGTSVSEAIVLIVRPFITNLGFDTSNWIELNVSYKSISGNQVTRVSDGYGIMILSDVAAPSKLNVNIQRLRLDGPVPFRFLSFQANRPTCFIEVSPQNTFTAPLPTILNPGASREPIPATVFFKTSLSSGHYGATIGVAAGMENSPHAFYVLSSDKKKWYRYNSGDLIKTPPSRVIEFSFTPDGRVSTLSREIPHMPVSIWTVHKSTGEAAASVPSSIAGVPAQDTQRGGSKGGFFLRLLTFTAFLFITYMILGIFYRYQQGHTEFPDMIPHANLFCGCGKCVQLMWRRLTGQGTGGRGEDYTVVDEHSTYAY